MYLSVHSIIGSVFLCADFSFALIPLIFAGVMELADVVDSKSTASDGVPVRVRPPAPKHSNPNLLPIGEKFGFVVFLKDVK